MSCGAQEQVKVGNRKRETKFEEEEEVQIKHDGERASSEEIIQLNVTKIDLKDKLSDSIISLRSCNDPKSASTQQG